ncbi:2-haloacid dehalogenase [Azoarcus indigens]|uniref:(S)-2-haloacid dehalogenase n=2 Tax=Azoarcus indigens TaxID=29545 RepID=A0A4R6DYM4_9RHOO|nr:2-haloacid dehalogenase [Azoarcus indigens]
MQSSDIAMTATPRLKAVVFDAFGTLFDVYSVGLLAEQLFPGKGEALAALWRQKQIEYSQLRTLAGRHRPFWELTRDALDFAARKLGLAMSEAAGTQLLNQYSCLSPFPENAAALRELKALGVPTAILSNGTPQMLEVSVRSAGLAGLFDHVLSVEKVERYKPHPDAYAMGPAALGCEAREILFVSANGWDAAGATWFGYTTFWINRNGQPAEALDVSPHGSGDSLGDVVEFIRRRRPG